MNCQMWQPVCPTGYRSLGYVATGGSRPSYDSIRCVKGEYTIQGQWNYVWNDKGRKRTAQKINTRTIIAFLITRVNTRLPDVDRPGVKIEENQNFFR